VVAKDATLDLSALYTSGQGGQSNGKVTLKGDIDVAKVATLKLSNGDNTGLPPEIDWLAGESIEFEKGSEAMLEDTVYVGAGGLYEWTAGSTNESSITIDANGVTVDGDVSSSKPNMVQGTTTIGPEATLPLDPKYGSMFFIANGSELKVEGTIKISGKDATGTNVSWIEFAGPNSKLTLMPGGTLDVEQYGALYADSMVTTKTLRISVYAVTGGVVGTTLARVKKSGTPSTNFVLTKTDDTGTKNVPAITVNLGKLEFSTGANQPVNVTISLGTATAGTLTAGDGTAIVFLGAAE
jgi:hypothetical protein